ncbi:hypothetical protein D3C71_1324740 [compost metagenome]
MLYFVQLLDVPQGLLGKLALVGGVQLEELAPRMSHAADLGHAEFKAGLVAAKIIADQLALPVLQEVAGVFSGAARAEVVNHRRQFRELAGGVGPDIGSMGFLRTRREHLHRRFIGVDHAMFEDSITQGIDQRL